jgi:hypothetical protein
MIPLHVMCLGPSQSFFTLFLRAQRPRQLCCPNCQVMASHIFDLTQLLGSAAHFAVYAMILLTKEEHFPKRPPPRVKALALSRPLCLLPRFVLCTGQCTRKQSKPLLQPTAAALLVLKHCWSRLSSVSHTECFRVYEAASIDKVSCLSWGISNVHVIRKWRSYFIEITYPSLTWTRYVHVVKRTSMKRGAASIEMRTQAWGTRKRLSRY